MTFLWERERRCWESKYKGRAVSWLYGVKERAAVRGRERRKLCRNEGGKWLEEGTKGEKVSFARDKGKLRNFSFQLSPVQVREYHPWAQAKRGETIPKQRIWS